MNQQKEFLQVVFNSRDKLMQVITGLTEPTADTKDRPLKDILIDMTLEADELARSLLIFTDEVDPDRYLTDPEAREWYDRIENSIRSLKTMVRSKYRREKFINYRTKKHLGTDQS